MEMPRKTSFSADAISADIKIGKRWPNGRKWSARFTDWDMGIVHRPMDGLLSSRWDQRLQFRTP